MRKLLTMVMITTAIVLSVVAARPAAGQSPQKRQTAMKIQIDLDGKTVSATLGDNATARDFASLLPLHLTLRDYARTEKIADLPRKLTTKGAPTGSDPSPGDIAYYAPWGNLAIYYKDSDYADGLIILGKLDSNSELLTAFGAGSVAIKLGE